MINLILASESPRRKQLLKQVGIKFKAIPSNAEEIIKPGLSPQEIVLDLSKLKAVDVFSKNTNSTVIAADTVVALDGVILGKPTNVENAKHMLRSLSGKEHSVFTGVTIVNLNTQESFYEETKVKFFDLTEDEIEWYVTTGEPMDKAGSYGIQGNGCILVERIYGDYFNVVGLPISKVVRKLKKIKI